MFYLYRFLFIIISIEKIGCQGDEALTDCRSKYIEQDKCQNDQVCVWLSWNPSVCSNICDIIPEKECVKKWDCDFQNGQCIRPGCSHNISEMHCRYNISCTWQDGKCVDETCQVLNAKQSRDCPTAYCAWNERRQLCYDKRCSQYPNLQLCQEITRCEWRKYKCINVQNSDL